MSLPERLGRLRRVRQLGAGGFATVWLYRDDELRSDVAVKALADNWAQRLDVRERFLEEARILRAADSDHVVRVHDLGETEGTPWFVMTYADRGSLDAGLLGEPWPPEEALPLITQAAAGLTVLHDHGIVHRDVKPQNLLLRSAVPGTGGGTRLMVADLGVAKAMLHASGLTQVVGTPAYMAPEQVTGQGLDTRADVHALAAVAYHLLTGRLLRDGGFADLVEARPPAAPSSLAALPTGVDDVLLRGVAASPADRWPDVGSFAGALRESLAGALAPTARTTVIRERRSDPEPVTPEPAAPEPAAAADAVVPVSATTRPGPSTTVTALLVVLMVLVSFTAAFVVVQALR